MWLYIVYLISIGILALAAFALLGGIKTRGSVERALNMTLFLISLPRENAREGQKDEKEMIAVMEQLYSSFTNLKAKGWNRFVYGVPYLALEMAVHHVGEEIHFYMSVPKSYADVFEKQVHGLFPTAEVQRSNDYNIFNPQGYSAAAILKLKESPILPLKTYATLPADPLGEIATSLSKLQKEGEGAAVQILIRPSSNSSIRGLATKVAKEMQQGFKFSTALSKAQGSQKNLASELLNQAMKGNNPGNEDKNPGAITPFEGDVVKAIQAKASKPLFDANIRLVVSAQTTERAGQLLNDMKGAFVQFASVEQNSLEPKVFSGKALKNLLYKFSFRIFENNHVSLLSTEEISSLFHFPLPTTQAPKIKFVKSKTSEPPVNLPAGGVVLGTNIFRGVTSAIRMTRNDRRRHLYVIGQTGTGKSTFMENVIYQDIAQGDGAAFIDPHGSAIEKILGTIPKERIQDVVVFDPADVQHPVGLNMLEYDPKFPEQKTFIVNELLGIFQKLFSAETMGPMFDQYFRNAVLLLLDDYEHEIPTLVNIPRVLTDPVYRRDKLSRETNPIVKNFWELEAEKAGGDAALANMAPYITSKINGFIANEFLRPILSQKKSSINFREIMDQKKILLVNLSKGRIGDLNANLVGMLVVGRLLMAALSRVDIPEEQRNDFYLYIDEFQNFTTDSIATILSEARKYKLNLVIAHQFIKQLVDKIRDAVFGNVGSMIAFRVGADDAEFLKTQFEPVFTPQDLMNIDNFNFYVKLLINNQTTRPFNVKVDPPHSSDPDLAQKIKELSRQAHHAAAEQPLP